MHAFIADIFYTQFHSTNPYLFYSMHLMGFFYTEAVFQRELRESLQIFTKKNRERRSSWWVKQRAQPFWI